MSLLTKCGIFKKKYYKIVNKFFTIITFVLPKGPLEVRDENKMTSCVQWLHSKNIVKFFTKEKIQ